jgi:hypothetical protein
MKPFLKLPETLEECYDLYEELHGKRPDTCSHKDPQIVALTHEKVVAEVLNHFWRGEEILDDRYIHLLHQGICFRVSLRKDNGLDNQDRLPVFKSGKLADHGANILGMEVIKNARGVFK